MHELGIVSGILETVSRAARDAGALRVVAVTLRIGDMREVVPETLDFAWDVLSKMTSSCVEASFAWRKCIPKAGALHVERNSGIAAFTCGALPAEAPRRT